MLGQRKKTESVKLWRRLDLKVQERIEQEAARVERAAGRVKKTERPGAVEIELVPQLGRPTIKGGERALRGPKPLENRRPTVKEAHEVEVAVLVGRFTVDGRDDIAAQVAEELDKIAASIADAAKRVRAASRQNVA